MPRRNDAGDHWYDDLGVSVGKLQRQVKCKFCPLTIAYRADRMLAHLDYRSPQRGVRDVSIARWFLAQQNNCLRIVEGRCLLCQMPHWRTSTVSAQKRK